MGYALVFNHSPDRISYIYSTNWGNIGHAGEYTSYDYGAAIAEDRTVAKEKYSELKLQANFIRASPAYLTSTIGANATHNGPFADSIALTTTRIEGNITAFYIVRHTAYSSLDINELQIDDTDQRRLSRNSPVELCFYIAR